MKLHPSAADYAAVAVAPLLIFFMISALANFIALMLYDGSYPQRVGWTLSMFTMGSVAIARIAIEQNRNYSLGYAAALGSATFVVMSQFVGSPLFCAFILVVIAYLADVIVRDCTIIDEGQDASGEGLIDARARKKCLPIPERPRKTHQPGRTVMYLALAALPLFGIGQFMLGSDPHTWTRAQFCLGLYLFAALALLVTTSFLGLRRYLRQRQAEMPGDVTIAWLGGGTAIIAAVLLIAYLVPLPGRALAAIELPKFTDSDRQRIASRFGWGDEAADNSQINAATTSEDQNAGKEIHSQTTTPGAEPGDVGDGNRQAGSAGNNQGGKPQGGNQQGDRQAEQQQAERGDQGEQARSKQSGEKQSGNEPQGNEQSDTQSSDTQSSDTQSSGDEPNGNQRGGDPPRDDQNAATDQPAGNSGSARQSSGELISKAISGLSAILKWLIALALALVVVRFLWQNWERLTAWFRGLLNSDRTQAEESWQAMIADSATPPRPYSSFRNPIGTETDPRRVVVITFQAFEAWAREQGAARGKHETPSEFVVRAARLAPPLGPPVAELVAAYNRIVYGRGGATDQDLAAADRLWKIMR